MADNPPYKRQFSFSGFQANKPRDPLPGPQIDRELDTISNRLGQLTDPSPGIHLRGHVASFAALPTVFNWVGDVFIVDSAGVDPTGQAYQSGDAYVYGDRDNPTGWRWIGRLRGYDGAPGAPGASGATAQFPVYDGGVQRSAIDRSRDYIVLHDLSDGSGSLSNDDAAVRKAVSMAISSNRAILQTRDFKIASEVTINGPLYWLNAAPGVTRVPIVGAKILPAAVPMRSVFNILSDGVLFDDVMSYNPADPNRALSWSALTPASGSALNTPDGPDALFRVEKTATDGYFHVRNLQVYGYPIVIDWIDGIRGKIEGIRGTKCGLPLHIRNNFLDSLVRDVINDYGGLVSMHRDASRSTTGPNGGAQGCEGTSFYACRCTETPGPAFGYNRPGVNIKAGYALDFFQVFSMQRYFTAGILLDGTQNPLKFINLYTPYVDVHAGSLGSGGVDNLDGIKLQGSIEDVNMYAPNVNGATGYGMTLSGTDASRQVYRFHVSGYVTLNNVKGDIAIANAAGSITASRFTSNKGVYEITGSTVKALGNWFAVTPQRISPSSNWLGNDGPGAFDGIPAAADSGNLARGNFYHNSGAVRLTGY